MRIILSDRADTYSAEIHDVAKVITTSAKKLQEYDNNSEVVAIVGSRSLAIEASKLYLPNLKFVQLTSAGFDNVPCSFYREKGVWVSNAGDVYSAPIAETVILGMLLMTKKIHNNPNNRHCKLTRQYKTITELCGKKVLIMGTGSIGSAVARRLQGFEVTIDGFNRSGRQNSFFSSVISNRSDLIDAIGEYDYIISTLPASTETRSFINSEMIQKMSRNVVIINVGRQSVFAENDLYSALKSRRINGAVLDMFEYLPNPFTNRYRRLSNVIVLPGVSAISQEVEKRLNAHISKNIHAVLYGEEPSCIVN